MRILMITDFYWPYVGGVEQHVRRLSQTLAARGHEVAVATLGSDDLPAADRDGQVRVYRMRGTTQRAAWLFKNPGRPWAPPFPDPEITLALRGILAKEQPDIVHGHDWLARSYLPLKTASPARLVMSLHYYTLSCGKKSLMRMGSPCDGPGLAKCLRCTAQHYGAAKGAVVTLANWVMNPAERAAVDMFISVSQATADGNGLTGKDRSQVIPNFMPDDRPSTLDVSSYLAQLPQEPFLLFVGDLRRDKGLEVLLEAYQSLHDADLRHASLRTAPPLVLIGKVWEETPKVFPANVTVLKNWPNEAVLAAWQRSLFGLVPSLWPEPFGIVVIEVMSSGRPVIASRTGGIPDIVQDGETGLLVPPGDAEALRQAMERLLQDPALRERMGRAAQRAAARYQASAVVPQIEALYYQVLETSAEDHEPPPAGQHHYQQL